jgi:hypothetical protein
MAIFAAILAGSLAVIVGLLVVFPNLRGNPGLLALAVLTPLLVGASQALSRSGLRALTPRAVTLPLRAALALVVLLDAVFLILPNFTHTYANDTAPTFVARTPQPSATVPAAVTASPTAAPPALRSGQFDHRQGGDTAAGEALLGTTADGSLVLRLQSFDATNGPDLYVYLSRVASPSTADQVMNGLQVAALKASSGNQNYTLPAGTDLTQFKSVVIYCKSFSVIFGYANLS